MCGYLKQNAAALHAGYGDVGIEAHVCLCDTFYVCNRQHMHLCSIILIYIIYINACKTVIGNPMHSHAYRLFVAVSICLCYNNDISIFAYHTHETQYVKVSTGIRIFCKLFKFNIVLIVCLVCSTLAYSTSYIHYIQ